ncbi:MAG TPA: NIL domain-containing protein, partial [Planctomycetota bacterium]|nr:NIL domain-containing protein [Planctomycetota bacterium]
LTFPEQVLNEPLLYTMAKNFQVAFNIKGAMLNQTPAVMALELDGDPAEIERATAFIAGKGVKIEVINDRAGT